MNAQLHFQWVTASLLWFAAPLAGAQDVSVATCLPDEAATLASALSVELDTTPHPCADADEAAVVVRVSRDGVLSGLWVVVRRQDGVQRSSRMPLPEDAMDARAVAVIIASLVREVRSTPAPASSNEAETSPPELDSRVDPAPGPPDGAGSFREPPTHDSDPAEPRASTDTSARSTSGQNAPEYLAFGVELGVGLDARWADASQTFRRTYEGHGMTIGGALRLHEPSGHGGALAFRWGTHIFGPGPEGRESVHIEARYAYRTPVEQTPLVLRVEVGFAIISGGILQPDGQVVAQIGLGPVLSGAALLRWGPWVSGLELAYTAVIDSSDATYGHGFEIRLESGFFFDEAFLLGDES